MLNKIIIGNLYWSYDIRVRYTKINTGKMFLDYLGPMNINSISLYLIKYNRIFDREKKYCKLVITCTVR